MEIHYGLHCRHLLGFTWYFGALLCAIGGFGQRERSELGIFLDVLIAVVILVILTSRLRLSFRTTDTNVLDKLKG